ncbi:hypothetical protein FSP39_006260 [Pinctada imbricata]|uniref:Methyltransferase domain-containing protein n=1 Tax=Pinctada imbricata TaxID=66713 RepID=A0AA89BW76_PINIB|nr:hypothetical protein FSP39_006260 [Pinctada imbricata]
MRRCKAVSVSLAVLLGLTYLGYHMYDWNVLVLLRDYVAMDICQQSQTCNSQCKNCNKETKTDKQVDNLKAPVRQGVMILSKEKDMTSRNQKLIVSQSDLNKSKSKSPSKASRKSKGNKETNERVNKNLQKVFEHIAVQNLWRGENETRSGTGSLLSSTVTMRECLGEWIKKYNITSVVDIPCGDGNWQRLIPGIHTISYRGFDISTFVIKIAQNRNPPNMKYGILDLTSDVPPKADLIIIRDAIQHLPLRLGKQAILNARRSGVKWIGISSYPTAKRNKDITMGGYYKNNIQISPFFLTNVVETCDNYSGYIKKNYLDSKFLLIRNIGTER